MQDLDTRMNAVGIYAICGSAFMRCLGEMGVGMISVKKSLLCGCVLLVINLGLTAKSSGSQSLPAIASDAVRAGWSELAFRANSLLADLSLNIRLEPLAVSEAQTFLPDSPRGIPVQSLSPNVYQLSFRKDVDAIFQPVVKTWNQI